VRFEYRAVKDCPSEAWVVRRIQARTDRFRRVTDGASARTFSIAIAEAAGGFLGTLEITEPDPSGGRTTSRRIEAPRCIEVADGLALIAALTIDPRAAEAAIGEPEPETQPAEKPPTAPSTPAPKPPVAPAETRAASAAEAHVEDAGTTARERGGSASYLRFGAGFVAAGGVAPESMYGAQVLGELGMRPGRHWFAWAARLNLRHVRREGLAFANGRADFRLTTAGIDLCPIRAPVPVLELGPCLTGEFGLLEAVGRENPEPQQSTRSWAALGGLLRAGVSLSQIGIEASAGAVVPLRRDRFFLGTQIGEVKSVVWSAGFALTGRID